MHRIPRPRAVLLSVVLLAAVPVSAPAAEFPGHSVAEVPSWLGNLWQGVVGLFAPLGPDMDPNGRQAPSGDTTELGPSMDPEGYEVVPIDTDRGGDMDPDG
jgi:hypothetical protein